MVLYVFFSGNNDYFVWFDFMDEICINDIQCIGF